MYNGNTVFFKVDGNNIKTIGDNQYLQAGLGEDFDSIKNITTVPIKDVANIYSNGETTFFLLKNGKVKGCGMNDKFQMGLPNTIDSDCYDLVDIPIDNVKEISVGTKYTIFILRDGTVKGCGVNDHFQLGLYEPTDYVRKITTLPIKDVRHAYCNTNHTIFLLKNLTVKVCGQNKMRVLGLEMEGQNYLITELKDMINVKRVVSTENNTFFVTGSGTKRYVTACGSNLNYQIGMADRFYKYGLCLLQMEDIRDVYANKVRSFFLTHPGKVLCCGSNYNKELGISGGNYVNTIKEIPGLSRVNLIIPAQNYTIFLMKNGTVKGCGKNELGQLGLGDTRPRNTIVDIPIQNVSKIVANDENVFYILKDGTVMACGGNSFGQLGLGDEESRRTLTKVPNINLKQYGFIIKQDNKFYSIKNEYYKNGYFKELDLDQLSYLNLGDDAFTDLSDFYSSFYVESEGKCIRPMDLFSNDAKILIYSKYRS